eukprot:TRINITY_DN433_c0_g1_i1.p2 TRINITY_DN433_c0_g1~~TRINITY_DN433_c0_g1_i1.p2  ORF type:complete len:122 (-),score=0.09 TRINITY_DN433_c0_g1_i1:40-405(-)
MGLLKEVGIPLGIIIAMWQLRTQFYMPQLNNLTNPTGPGSPTKPLEPAKTMFNYAMILRDIRDSKPVFQRSFGSFQNGSLKRGWNSPWNHHCHVAIENTVLYATTQQLDKSYGSRLAHKAA